MKLLKTILSPILASAVAFGAGTAQADGSPTAQAETQFVEIDSNRIAYRIVGNRPAVPLLLLNRFRGTMDHWDPLLIDRIAEHRPVIMFDQPGFARSGGQPPASLAEFAGNAAKLAGKLGYGKVDVLGFSMGGMVALQFALDHPGLLRKLVIAGSGPGHVAGMPPGVAPAGPAVWQVATRPVNVDDDFMFLFFEPTETSKAAGRAYLERLKKRKDAFVAQVDAAAWQAQLRSAQSVGTPEASLLPRLTRVHHPVLVANGRRDIMVPTYASYAMAQVLPNATLMVYPDSGHGFLFQHAETFARDVLQFLQ
jgi:pimeloyl-ACP methyl ester carboxylesterase